MVGQPLRQNRPEQGQRLGGLAQVMTGGGQEADLGLTGAHRLIPRGAQPFLLPAQPRLHALAAAGVHGGHDDARGLSPRIGRKRHQRDVEPLPVAGQGQFLGQPPARGGHRLGKAVRRVLPAAPDEGVGHGPPDQLIPRATDGALHRRVGVGKTPLPVEQGDRHADHVENPPQCGGVGGETADPRPVLLSHRLLPSDCKPAYWSARPTISRDTKDTRKRKKIPGGSPQTDSLWRTVIHTWW